MFPVTDSSFSLISSSSFLSPIISDGLWSLVADGSFLFYIADNGLLSTIGDSFLFVIVDSASLTNASLLLFWLTTFSYTVYLFNKKRLFNEVFITKRLLVLT